jgi:hypothetical protein
VTVSGQAPTQAIPQAFLGFSTEFTTLPLVTKHIPEYERVLYNLTPEGTTSLVLRIGGDSAQHVRYSKEPIRSPPWAFSPTRKLVVDTARVIDDLGLRVILNINTVSSTQHEAAAWMRGLTTSVQRSRGKLSAFEIGNEPDIYSEKAWEGGISIEGGAAPNPAGVRPADLPEEITATSFAKSFQAYARALQAAVPKVPVIAPAVAEATKNLGWIKTLLRYRTKNLKAVSAHIYPYSACAEPGQAKYPTIHKILSEHATAGMARTVAPAISVAQKAGLSLRLTEINSVTCGGVPGVSDTFATALWAPAALFSLLRAGVDGVNVHIRADTVNSPFALGARGLVARPLLYGLALFTRTLGPDAELVSLRLHAARSLRMHAWAVRVAGGALHVLLINDGRRPVRVSLRLPTAGAAWLQRLLARSARARFGVTLDGQRLGPAATWMQRAATGVLALRRGGYELTLPSRSAALLGARLQAGAFDAPRA